MGRCPETKNGGLNCCCCSIRRRFPYGMSSCACHLGGMSARERAGSLRLEMGACMQPALAFALLELGL